MAKGSWTIPLLNIAGVTSTKVVCDSVEKFLVEQLSDEQDNFSQEKEE